MSGRRRTARASCADRARGDRHCRSCRARLLAARAPGLEGRPDRARRRRGQGAARRICRRAQLAAALHGSAMNIAASPRPAASSHGQEALVYTVLRPTGRLPGPGYWVLTPAQLAGGAIVIVNRGFVPLERKDPATPREGAAEGRSASSASCAGRSTRSLFTPANEPARNAWYRRDPAAIATHLGLARRGAVHDRRGTPRPFRAACRSAARRGQSPQQSSAIRSPGSAWRWRCLACSPVPRAASVLRAAASTVGSTACAASKAPMRYISTRGERRPRSVSPTRHARASPATADSMCRRPGRVLAARDDRGASPAGPTRRSPPT